VCPAEAWFWRWSFEHWLMAPSVVLPLVLLTGTLSLYVYT
jgi:hypothetical protein